MLFGYNLFVTRATVLIIEMTVIYMDNHCFERVHRKRKDLLLTCDFVVVVGGSLSFSAL